MLCMDLFLVIATKQTWELMRYPVVATGETSLGHCGNTSDHPVIPRDGPGHSPTQSSRIAGGRAMKWQFTIAMYIVLACVSSGCKQKSETEL